MTASGRGWKEFRLWRPVGQPRQVHNVDAVRVKNEHTHTTHTPTHTPMFRETKRKRGQRWGHQRALRLGERRFEPCGTGGWDWQLTSGTKDMRNSTTGDNRGTGTPSTYTHTDTYLN